MLSEDNTVLVPLEKWGRLGLSLVFLATATWINDLNSFSIYFTGLTEIIVSISLKLSDLSQKGTKSFLLTELLMILFA